MSCQDAVNPQRARRLHDADVVYLYDGSFEGFLCCVFESFAQHEIPFAVWTPQRETATLYPVRDIETDSARAQRVFSALGRKLGRETEYLVSRDFLSGQEDKELLLIRFLHLAFALGPGAEDVGVDERPGDALPSDAAPARVRPGKAPAGDEILRPLEDNAHPFQLVQPQCRLPPGIPDPAGTFGANARHPQQHLEGGAVHIHREQPVVLHGPVAFGVQIGVEVGVVPI